MCIRDSSPLIIVFPDFILTDPASPLPEVSVLIREPPFMSNSSVSIKTIPASPCSISLPNLEFLNISNRDYKIKYKLDKLSKFTNKNNFILISLDSHHPKKFITYDMISKIIKLSSLKIIIIGSQKAIMDIEDIEEKYSEDKVEILYKKLSLIEKIEIFYKNSNSKIKLEEVKILLNDSSSQNLNKMNEHVMFGNTSKSSKIINKLLSEGTSPISLVRSLINYLLRVQQTKIEMKKGNNFDSSIKILKPPVFWKDKDNFQKHCFKWPLQSIEANLNRLLETELACKLNIKLAVSYTHLTLPTSDLV